MSSGSPIPALLANGDATEVAQVLVQLVTSRAVPADVVEELRRLISHDLARKNVARLRYARLALLMQLISEKRDAENRWVTQAEYMEERARLLERGEEYPDESTIRAAYGNWISAIKAASEFTFTGGRSRVPTGRQSYWSRNSYTLDEIKRAILRCFFDIGQWPTEWEYGEWSTIQRHFSSSDPRLPGEVQIRKAFGDYNTALTDVRRGYERGQERSAREQDEQQPE